MAAGAYYPDWSVDGANWPLRDASMFVEAGGYKWHAQMMGEGPALLLLHGTGAATHSWAPAARLLSEKYKVLNVDLPGHGFTRATRAGPPSLERVATATKALLDELSFRPRVVVGHSAGAAVMSRMALEGDASADLLISVNGALRPFPGPARFMFPAFAKALQFNPLTPYMFAQGASDERRVRRLIVSTGSMPPEEQIGAYAALLRRPGHIAGALGMMANWDLGALERALPSIDQRAVMIAAANDRAVPPGDARRLVSAMKNAEHALVPDCGHLAHEEAPEAIVRIINDKTEAMGLA